MLKQRLRKNSKLKMAAIFVIMTAMIGQAFAQLEIKRFSINSGGSKMTGGTFEMRSSIGQVDASTKLSNGNYSLNGGFWHENTDLIFRNGLD